MLSKLLSSRKSKIILGASLAVACAGVGYLCYQALSEVEQLEKSMHILDDDFSPLKNLQKSDTKQFNKIDMQTLSNIEKIKCTHYDIQMEIDFQSKVIHGCVNYQFSVEKRTRKVLLDIRNLKIINVTLNGTFLKFSIVRFDKYKDTLGDQLLIQLPEYQESNSKFEIKIKFKTSESKESGLNWLNPSQTEGKKYPYFFTYSQPIWNRTIFPCQDTPSIKSTYTAQITVPSPFKAYCSAKLINKIEQPNQTIMNFKQNIPIPSYLFAIIAGNLEERKISERISIISEPEVIDKYCKELEDVEIYLKTLEEIITPYEWDEYKIAVLPTSFPYGGMENPLLNYISPSIIIGDKSGVDTIIHDISHSWSGNLFSCKNWNSFWLNEGWNVYFEYEAIRKLKGEEEYQIKFHLLDIELKKTIDNIGHEHSYTTLNPDIGFNDPDDAFSIVPFARGMQFLTHLSDIVGKQVFTKFTRDFVEKHKYKSLNTQDFKNYFYTYFGREIYEKVDWESWIDKPGYPPEVFQTKCEGFEKPKRYATIFLETNTVSKQEWDSYSVQQKIIFLQEVNIRNKLTQQKVMLLDDVLELSNLQNSEIYSKWYEIALCMKYAPIIPKVQKYLSQNGRYKYIRNIYTLLDEYDHNLAVETFKQNESLYYGDTHDLIKQELQL